MLPHYYFRGMGGVKREAEMQQKGCMEARLNMYSRRC